mmetsp:Transcript_38562/g.78657  ORF Transcript_38562/g.78657 Transcript_38562/m.78657 type:complete len:103 (-) Transcript_38562:134-442(-)
MTSAGTIFVPLKHLISLKSLRYLHQIGSTTTMGGMSLLRPLTSFVPFVRMGVTAAIMVNVSRTGALAVRVILALPVHMIWDQQHSWFSSKTSNRTGGPGLRK